MRCNAPTRWRPELHTLECRITPSVPVSGGDFDPDVILSSQENSSRDATRNTQGGTVRGFVYRDVNFNGMRDEGEPALRNIRLFLDLSGDLIQDPGEPVTVSREDGSFELTAPNDGTFFVQAFEPDGFFPSSSPIVEITLEGGNVLENVNFGFVSEADLNFPRLVGRPQFAVGAGPGNLGRVTFYNPDESVRFSRVPFGGFQGGIRTAVGDVTRDGIPDLIVASGPGGPPRIKIYSGANGSEVADFEAFESAFTGGIFVAAGDFDGDGFDDIVISPDEGGGPRVQIRRGHDQVVIADFFGIDDPNFRGGARIATGDVNGDGTWDLLVAAGFGGGPRVAGFDGATILDEERVKLFPDFFVFEETLRNGVFIAAGDLDGDILADVIVGAGPGGGPRVLALSGLDLIASQGEERTQLANFFAGDPNNRGGVRVAVKDLDRDDRADLVVGDGDGAGTRVTAYAGRTIEPNGVPPVLFEFDAFPNTTGGVFVG